MKKRKGTKCEFTNTNAVSAQSKRALSLNLCVGFELLIVKQNLGGFVILITIDLDNLTVSLFTGTIHFYCSLKYFAYIRGAVPYIQVSVCLSVSSELLP